MKSSSLATQLSFGRVALVAALTGAIACAAPAAAGAAATLTTHTVHFTCKAPTATRTSSRERSTCTGSPFGSLRELIDTSQSPLVYYHFTSPQGTFELKGLPILKGKDVTINWHAVRGTGRFRHVTGSGRATGQYTAGSPYLFTGKLSY